MTLDYWSIGGNQIRKDENGEYWHKDGEDINWLKVEKKVFVEDEGFFFGVVGNVWSIPICLRAMKEMVEKEGFKLIIGSGK